MPEKIITKSFERLLDKGKNRGFITYDELGKSLGKRGSSLENIEKAFIIIVDNKVTLVEKKSQYQSNKKKETTTQTEEKTSDKSDDPIRRRMNVNPRSSIESTRTLSFRILIFSLKPLKAQVPQSRKFCRNAVRAE